MLSLTPFGEAVEWDIDFIEFEVISVEYRQRNRRDIFESDFDDFYDEYIAEVRVFQSLRGNDVPETMRARVWEIDVGKRYLTPYTETYYNHDGRFFEEDIICFRYDYSIIKDGILEVQQGNILRRVEGYTLDEIKGFIEELTDYFAREETAN
jgi:hypothetical protein